MNGIVLRRNEMYLSMTGQCQAANCSYEKCLLLFIAKEAGHSEAQETRKQMKKKKGFPGS